MMSPHLTLNTMPVEINCQDLGYHVGPPPGLDILKQVSFTGQNGELIGICGPNGAGKSTLLRQLGGLIEPSAGSVCLNGQSVRAYKPRKLARLVSFLHQDTVMPFAFPSHEVVLMGRHPYQSSLAAWSAQDMAYVEACMAAADCQDEADKLVTTLSGGERQRVMIARLLAQDTPVILLDEPTASLDIRHTQNILKLARDLADAGKLVIMVIHDLRAAARFCTRICLMVQGHLVADGQPADVLHEGHIAYAYGVRAHTFQNPVGQWDYYIEEKILAE
jgi:ABC-type cobalamin/Fe3+-siderophores transport system ATPase subunit